MATSNFTKKIRMKLRLLWLADFVLLFLPVIIYVGIALFSDGVLAVGRVSVVTSIFIAAVLSVFNVIAQKRMRCPIWIILIGLYVAIKEWLLPLIIILAVTSVLDDLVFTPLISHYTARAKASKLIDDRMGDNVREEL